VKKEFGCINLNKICIIGAGLAGSEIAYQLSMFDLEIDLYEARLIKEYSNSVHLSSNFAELVCSNSFRSNELHNAVGLLKEELRLLNSFIISVADKFSIPSGSSLAVSRLDFSSYVTEVLKNKKNINIIPKEIEDLESLIHTYDIVILASGPLTSLKLSNSLKKIISLEYLYFYDAIAPLIYKDTIDMNYCFFANRYDANNFDYLNIPFDKEEYLTFINLLIEGDKTPINQYDKDIFFQACQPIEEMVKSGLNTLRNGPMRGDGLIDPKTKKEPYAAIQLRKDNYAESIFNMVGFQTRLKYFEQERIFKTIPALKKSSFSRYGTMHRNTYINSPALLNSDLSLKVNNKVFIAGQLSGVEGYVESVAEAYMVSEFIKARLGLNNKSNLANNTAIKSLINYILNADSKNFQPMKMNFGLFNLENINVKGKINKRIEISKNSINYLKKL